MIVLVAGASCLARRRFDGSLQAPQMGCASRRVRIRASRSGSVRATQRYPVVDEMPERQQSSRRFAPACIAKTTNSRRVDPRTVIQVVTPVVTRTRNATHPAYYPVRQRDQRMTVAPSRFVGIDVSKKTLDVALLPSGELRQMLALAEAGCRSRCSE